MNQLATYIVDQATAEPLPAEVSPEPNQTDKNPAAVQLARLGGLKGGKARAAKLTAEKRKQIARNAAAARWGKK